MSFTKRAISAQTAEEVLERDRYCIFCGAPIQELHHAYYGSQANRNKNRNDTDQLVGLCCKCHWQIHSGKDSQRLRQACIDYLTDYYNGA